MVKEVGQGLKSALNERLNLLTIAKGILVSFIITIPIFVIFAFILTYTNFPEKFITAAVVLTTVFSIIVAGSAGTKGIKSKGWLNGAVVGFLYMLVLYALSSLVYRNFSIDRNILIMTVIGVLAGSIGGIAGINIKSSSRQKYRSIKR